MNNDVERLLSWPQVRPMVGGIGRATWWRAIRRGDAPPAIKISPRRVAWRESDIRDWQAGRKPSMPAVVGEC